MDETWHETACFRVDKNKNERQVKGELGHMLQFHVRRERNSKGFPQRVWEHVENCNIPQPLPERKFKASSSHFSLFNVLGVMCWEDGSP